MVLTELSITPCPLISWYEPYIGTPLYNYDIKYTTLDESFSSNISHLGLGVVMKEDDMSTEQNRMGEGGGERQGRIFSLLFSFLKKVKKGKEANVQQTDVGHSALLHTGVRCT